MAPFSGASFVVGDNVTLTANAFDPDGQITNVEFFANGSAVGSVSSAPYNFVWNNIPDGVFTLTARATDNSGASANSASVNFTVKRSPGTVTQALSLANSIVSGFEWSDTYPGASGGSNSTAVVANLDALATDIRQAYIDFTLERNLFGSSTEQIDTQLLGAYYFARGDAALAAQSGTAPNIKAHLQRVIGHLSVTGDLMRYGSITPATIQLAQLVGARLDLIIGSANSGLSPAADGLVSPGSLGAVFATSTSIPLSTHTTFATLSSSNSLPYDLEGVSVSVGAQALPIFYISPGRVSFFVPQNLPAGDNEMIVISQNGYVSKGSVSVTPNVTRIMTAADDEAGPVLAVNAAKQVRETLSVTTQLNFSDDKRTRVTFFATGVSGSAANTDSSNDVNDHGTIFQNVAESVTVEARTQDNRVYQLPVEFAGARGVLPGLDQITVVLVPQLQGAGTVNLTLIVNGRRSNAPTIVVQ
jgi:uncharacterized protein (TIGR03437 family)